MPFRFTPGLATSGKTTTTSSTGGKFHFTPGLAGGTTSGGLDLTNLEDLASQVGSPPPPEYKPGMLSRFLGLLAAGETAPGVYKALETGDIGQGAAEYGKEALKGVTGQGYDPEKKNYVDVLRLLGMPEGKIWGPLGVRNVLGLAADIGLDPTTYVGGALIKKVVAPATRKVAGTIIKPALKTKTGLKVAEGAKDLIGRMFKPGYDVAKLGEKGEEYLDMVNKLHKGVRGETLARTKEIAQKAAELTKQYGPETGKTVSEVVETGVKTGLDGIDEMADILSTRSKEIAQTEGKLGLLKGQMDNYLRHYLTPEARDFLQKYGPDSISNTIRKYKVSLGAAKKRTIAGSISQINEDFMKTHGVNLFEPNAFKAWAGREAEHIKAIKMDTFLREVQQKFGVKGTAPQIIDGVQYVIYQPKGALRFYKGKFTPGEDILRQIGYQLYDNPVSMPQLLEQSFTKVGQAMQFAEDAGLTVQKMKGGGRNVLGSAMRGGAAFGGEVNLRAFISSTIAHELGHAFDLKLSRIINTKKIYRNELGKLVEWTGLGGSAQYRASAVERFAEFISSYIHNPQKVKEIAPEFTLFFERKMLPKTSVGKLVDKLGTFFQKVNGLDNITTIGGKSIGLKQKLAALGGDKYAEKAIRMAFPEKTYIGVSKKVSTYLLPKPIAESLSVANKALTDDSVLGQIAAGYDKLLNLWKGSVTGFFPAFHGRNAIGGIFNNFIAGLNPWDVGTYAQGMKIAEGKAGEIVTKAGKKISFDEVRDAIRRLGVSGQSGYLDVFKDVEQTVKEAGETGLRKVATQIKNAPQTAMGFIEDRLRIPLFINQLKKGASFDEAAKKVVEFHFDYAPEAFTDFEKQFMKRLIPFYTWTRNNIPLQITQMMQQPGKYAGIAKFMKSLRGETTGEEIKALPQYMQEQFPIEIPGGDVKGSKQYAYGLGLPMEEIGELFGGSGARTLQKALGKTSPAVKLPLELAAGKSFYLNKPLEDINYVSDTLANVPGMKQLLRIREETNKAGKKYYVTARPELLHILTSALGRFYTTTGKLTQDDMASLSKILYSVVGLKTRAVDLEAEQGFRDTERRKELEQFLEREGVLRQFQRYYKPKE